MVKHKASSFACLLIVILNCVRQTARVADNRKRSVNKRVNLVEAARLIVAGHDKEVASSFDKVAERVAVADVGAEVGKL